MKTDFNIGDKVLKRNVENSATYTVCAIKACFKSTDGYKYNLGMCWVLAQEIKLKPIPR